MGLADQDLWVAVIDRINQETQLVTSEPWFLKWITENALDLPRRIIDGEKMVQSCGDG
jgi:hypothetical protein